MPRSQEATDEAPLDHHRPPHAVAGISGTADLRPEETADTRKTPDADGAGVDERCAGERRGSDRFGEARPAARIVLDHIPGRRRSVRSCRQAGHSIADGRDAQRGDNDP